MASAPGPKRIKSKGRAGPSTLPEGFVDQQQYDTKVMLDEIRGLLASSDAGDVAPQPLKSPFAYMPGFVKDMQKREKQREVIKTKKLKGKPSTEELLEHITSQSFPKVAFSHEEVQAKSLLMPYADKTIMADERIKLVDVWRGRESELEAQSTSAASDEEKGDQHSLRPQQPNESTASIPDAAVPSLSSSLAKSSNQVNFRKLFRRYPRLTSIFRLNEGISSTGVKIRSNVWMAKFMEECYDEAFSFCSKELSDARRRKRCGLDLGALDAFPLIAQRLLSRTYSVLEIRQRVCFEVLATLEHIISIGETSLLAMTADSECMEVSVDGGRAQMFSRFLSEELDLDYLAMFLHARDLIQTDLAISLVDINPQHTLPIPNHHLHASQPQSNPINDRLAAIQSETHISTIRPIESVVVPYELPGRLHYVSDVTMPHTPLVSFEVSKLPWLCGIVAPNASVKLRLYLADRVVKVVEKLLQQSRHRVVAFLQTAGRFMQPMDAPISVTLIPIAVFINVILEEWRAVPVDAKANIGSGGESSDSLKKLNDIYDGDNAKMKAFAQMTRNLEAELILCDSTLLKLDKDRRRLERKWKNKLASAEDLQELQNVRVKQTETKSARTSIETRLDIVRKRERVVKDSMDDLWGSAAQGTEVEQVPEVDKGESTLAPSKWREEVGSTIVSALEYNEESVAAIKNAQIAFEASMKELDMKLAKESEPVVQFEPSIADQIAALEAGALELSRLGHEEMLELGILPPAPPASIQASIDLKEQQKLREMERQKEIVLEAECAAALASEDAQMRTFLADERFFMDHNCRVMKFEEDLMRTFVLEESARKLEAISALALSEMTLLINGAVREIAEATMIRKIDEILKAQAEEEIRVLALEQLRIKTKKQIEVAVSTYISVATAAAQDRVLHEVQRALAAEAMKMRVLTISKLATAEVSGFLETSVIKIVADAIHEMVLARDRKYRLLLHKQRLELIHDTSVSVVENVVFTSFQQAIDHFDRLELEFYMQLEMKMEAIASETVESALNPIVAIEWVSAADSAVEAAIEEADQAEALRIKQIQDAAKARRHMIYQSKRIAKSFMPIVIHSATIAAKKVLVDPWRPLNFEPHDFVSEDVLASVEEYFFIARMQLDITQKKRLFRGFRFPIVKKNKERTEKLAVWKYMRGLVDDRRLRHKMALRMQRVARLYIDTKRRRTFAAYLRGCDTRADVVAGKYRKKRAGKMIQWWKYWAHAEQRGKVVTFNIRERRFLICYYTWRMHFKNAMEKKQIKGAQCEKAALIIQCAIRMKLARLRCRNIRAILCIVSLGKRFFARRSVRQARRRGRILHEHYLRQLKATQNMCMRKPMKQWKDYFNRLRGLQRLHMFTMKKFVRRRFLLWKRGYQNLSKLLNKCAAKIQATVRMWIIKRYVLHFYRFRRGIVAVQSNARRRILIPFFRVQLRYYRSAIAIQRSFRGQWTRAGITARRIIDLHHAASTNNYDRLKYYVTKYTHLLYELDEEGNSPLANAAKNAARRTLKLLMRNNVPLNAVNYAGYSALHLAIMSPAANRNDVVIYMLERGFDDDQMAPGDKSCLLLAAEYGRGVIASQLLANGMNPNIPDETGLTCLQTACSQGFIGIARELVTYGADVNMPGYCGTVPLHDCIASGNIDFPNLLISHGAHVNATEPFSGQTPLMWACRAGMADFVKLYVFQGAHIDTKDKQGWTAAHHGATSDSEQVYQELRFGDADFDLCDLDGNTPLHIAGECGSDLYADALLLGCVNPSIQNKDGNQASHIAARDNNLKVLKRICVYDTHIGRVNYAHQTPLGMAKFHNAPDTRQFLEEHYRKVEIKDGRNKVGDIWWDRAIDAIADDWKVVVGFLGEREYINEKTGERSLLPPSMHSDMVMNAAQFVEIPIKPRVVLVDEENTLTRHGYKKDYKAFSDEVNVMARIHRAALCIQKFAMRKSAYMELSRLKEQKLKRKVIGAFIRRRIKRFMHSVLTRRNLRLAKLQSAWRGKVMRKAFFQDGAGERIILLLALAKRNLGRRLLKLWKQWKRRQALMSLHIAANLPKTKEEWQKLVVEARVPRRTVAMYEEYIYPGATRIYFYRHKVSHDCSFQKPSKMRAIDDQAFRDAEQVRKNGCTTAQYDLTVKLQAMWRGYKIRSYYTYVETAMNISLCAEKKYMTSPDTDSNLYNYALHCHCIMHDYPRARNLYYESMRRMEWRGPDVAFVLYSYAIFACYTHDLDISDILALLERGRIAEETREVQLRKARGQEASQAIANGTFRHGQVFELANIGFFRHYATEHESEASWHNYALCRFLVFNDFATSFDAFLMAFKYAPSNVKLKGNFDIMLRHFHGTDKNKLHGIVRARMAYLADKDVAEQNIITWRRETAYERGEAAAVIKKWYKRCKSKKQFKSFMDVVKAARELKAKRGRL